MASLAKLSPTTGGQERIHDISLLYQTAFANDPVFTYMLDMSDTKKRRDYLYKYFTRLLRAAAMNKAEFDEVDDYGCATCILPPGKKLDNPLTLIPSGLAILVVDLSLRACTRMLYEFSKKASAAKKRGLKGCKQYWYLFSIATSPAREGQGLASTLLKAAQARAAKHGLPLWLESTTERSMNVYLRNGFQIVEPVITFGAGTHDSDGKPALGGPGVTLWPMVWWPPKLPIAKE